MQQFHGSASGKELASPKRRGFDPGVGKIPWRRAWQPTPVFLPGESPWTGTWHAAVHGIAESDTAERLSTA